ncbi:polyketide cyclase/dehydrase/lipid transport protein [Isoptericola sp. CG 20/1183]|uniref:Polyketide cyclase/dehydrase/lipid transport protein n=1 Tax=Isoptericola halotolerans TaxID=300560 RepID=A0ABX5ED59_9MICO|nr:MULTISPECIES: SRPBCC family protein [Isoptericola]MCK0118816.1 SRPBCC family protein [Isoptericola sp. S6320L]PRZ06344.1 polyketide cyclase/dehydrase/lipid transport protein [Isoptericola halotolerans]PRZ06850.1 polyketide cyclase/dehydrase/lipid transport protein [Isoptericola sp. CG 20/1183]
MSPRPPHRVEVSRLVPLDAETAFARVTDPRLHPRWIPLTRFEGDPTVAPAPGVAFTMVSGPGARRGRDGFVDRMTTLEHLAPSTEDAVVGRNVVRKDGPALLGTAGLDVVPVDEHRSRVVWWEEAYLAGPWPRRLNAAAVGVFLRGMLALALWRFGREVSRGGRR